MLDHGSVEADWCIIDGPPEIQLGNKGRVDILVTVKGKQAHSSRPWEGINAIDGAMKVLDKLKSLMPYPESKSHAELGKVSLTPNAIESFPKATHTVQSECRIMFDRRLLPGDDPAQAVQQLKDALGKIAPFEIEITFEMKLLLKKPVLRRFIQPPGLSAGSALAPPVKA